MIAKENNNERADAGETVNLEVSLMNIRYDIATGVSATLTSDDPDVQITQNTANFGDLARAQSSSKSSRRNRVATPLRDRL